MYRAVLRAVASVFTTSHPCFTSATMALRAVFSDIPAVLATVATAGQATPLESAKSAMTIRTARGNAGRS